MKRNKIRILTIATLSSLVLLTAVAGLTLQYLFNGKVKELFVRELNKQLATEVKVDDIKLSLFRDFPFASVRFTGVQMKEATGGKTSGNLLKAGLIAMKFNIPDLLRNKFSVHYVSIADAEFRLHYFSDGTDNYHILKSSNAAESSQFQLDIRRISFSNARFIYLDDAAQQSADLTAETLLLKGRFRNESFRMNLSGKVQIEEFKVNKMVFIDKRAVKLNADVDIETSKGLYTVSNGQLILDKLQLSTNGWMIHRNDRQEMNLTISASNTPVNKIISLIPDKYNAQLSNYNFDGTGAITLLIKGLFGGGHTPAVTANITLNDGNIIHRKTNVGLQELKLSVRYVSLQDSRGMNLNISNFNAKLKNGAITGSIIMDGLESPAIKASFSGEFDLAGIRDFLHSDTITRLSGMMNITGSFSGKIADIQHPSSSDFRNSTFTGICNLSNVDVGLKGYNQPVTGLSGTFHFDNNDLVINALNGKFGESDYSIRGSVGNLLAKLFVKGEKLIIDGSLVSEKINWDEISTSSEGTSDYSFGIPGDIEIGNLKLDIRNFRFRKFDARNLTAMLAVHNRILTADNILLQSMQGTVSGKATINASNPSHSILTCDARVNKVNINKLFTEFGNFGNTDLVAENLDGRVTGKVLFSGLMYPNLDMDLESIKSHAELMVEDGRLVNYEPMMDLSTFLRVEDLKDIRFETLTNEIDIANQVIYIPVMEIKTSALNLTLMGTHTFDNEINYHFSIALADILASKFRKRNPGYSKQEEFGPLAEDNRGRTMVYVSMTGTVDKPVFGYDKKAVRQKLGSEMQNQQSELKQVFSKEFRRTAGDSLSQRKSKKDKETQKKQEEGKFVIEWDDDDRK